jgi:hypothetical protein
LPPWQSGFNQLSLDPIWLLYRATAARPRIAAVALLGSLMKILFVSGADG